MWVILLLAEQGSIGKLLYIVLRLHSAFANY